MEGEYQLLIGIILVVTALNSLILLSFGRRYSPKPDHKLQPKTAASGGENFEDAMKRAEWQAGVQKRVDEQIEHFLHQFSNQLTAIGLSVNQKVSESTGQLLSNQISESQKLLEQVHQAAKASITQIQEDLEQKRLKLEQDLKQQLESERRILIDKLDRHLGQVVSSYLVESLGDQVDLGAQLPYILAQLEKDKDAIQKDLTNGA